MNSNGRPCSGYAPPCYFDADPAYGFELSALQTFAAAYPSKTSTWTGSDPCASWTGIVCNGVGRVTQMYVPLRPLLVLCY